MNYRFDNSVTDWNDNDLQNYIVGAQLPTVSAVANYLFDKECEAELNAADVEKAANISPALHSSIFNYKNPVLPKKNTLLAFGIALGFGIREFEELMRLAGYHFPYDKTDMVVKYFVEHNMYATLEVRERNLSVDIDCINSKLTELGLTPLGSQKRGHANKPRVSGKKKGNAVNYNYDIDEEEEENIQVLIRVDDDGE